MKKALFLAVLATTCTITASAGALRIADHRGETLDYTITAASLKNGTVSLEARKYIRGLGNNLEEADRRYFNIGSDVLKANGIEPGSLISIVLSKSIHGDVFCEIVNYAPKRSAKEISCDSIVITASPKE